MNGMIKEAEGVITADISWARSRLLQIKITSELAGKFW